MWLVLVVFFSGLSVPPVVRCVRLGIGSMWALVDGLSFMQAAHVVGVSKRTGRVWRHGRTRSRGWCERAGIASQAHWCRLYVTCHPHRISQGFLSFKERMLIFGWRVEGLSIRDIARQLGRSPSTVSRELKRNGITSTCDNPYIAHMRAGKRLKRPQARKCANPRLWGIIWDKLELRWSPEQICAYLRMRFPHKSEHEPVRRGRSTSPSSSKPQAHSAKRLLPSCAKGVLTDAQPHTLARYDHDSRTPW